MVYPVVAPFENASFPTEPFSASPPSFSEAYLSLPSRPPPRIFVESSPRDRWDPQPQAGTLYQVGELAPLLRGGYAGIFSLNDVRSVIGPHSEGLGTFHALDGELVMIEGEVYQIQSDGHPHRVDANSSTPFLATFNIEASTAIMIDPARDLHLQGGENQAALTRALSTFLNPNLAYGVVIVSRFDSILFRSPPRQREPYPVFSAVQASQFPLTNTSATLVGTFTPSELRDVSGGGLHLHGLTANRQQGGHVLGFSLPLGALIFVTPLDHVEVLRR